MPTSFTIPLSPVDITTSPISTVVYYVHRDSRGQIIDFSLGMLNTPALAIWNRPQSELVGKSIHELMADAEANYLLNQFRLAVESGRSVQFQMNYPGPSDGATRNFQLEVEKMDQGVLVRYSDVLNPKQPPRQESQTQLIETIFESTVVGITAYEAIRDSENGQILDFRYLKSNHKAVQFINLTSEQVEGRLLSEVYPDYRTKSFFSDYLVVIETGQICHKQNYFPDLNLWVDATISKLNDGVLITFSDITKAKQEEAEKLRQADLLESIQHSSQTAIAAYKAIRDASGTIINYKPIFRNLAAARLAHQPLEIGDVTLLDSFPNIKSTDLFDRYVRVTETGIGEQAELYYNDNGIEGWFNVSIQPWGDGFVSNVLDTSELRKIEREKLHQSILHQQVIDNMQAGMLLARPVRNEQNQITDFQFILTNEYNARLMGLSVAEMTGAPVGDLFVNWQQSDLFRWFVETMETGQIKHLTFLYDEYGAKGWFDGSFSCLDGCILYTYTDVTALKEAELVQQHQAELLEKVMNTTPASIVVHESVRDETGEITDFRMVQLNQVAADLFQNSIENIQHRRISRYFPGLLETPLFAHYKQVVQTGVSLRTDVFWAGGWYDISVARLGDGIVVAFQDITAKKESRRQLEMANLELKRSNENLESFAYVASHDLQEPLRKIVTFANILHIQYKDQFDEDATDIIKRLTGSAERMRLLIQDILAYSRIKIRQDSLQRVNIANVIEELAENELWAVLHQSKAQLRLNELPTLLADASQMHQLFQNLISNAIKFCPTDVTPVITVSCRKIDRSEGPADLMSATSQAFYEISVADNGIGFDEKYINRIFQVFQRLHGKNKYAGSGIGLAICQKIIERHEGAITASSQPGKGSTFRVYLPVR